jgi:uncharacterized membrane protein
MEKGIGGLNKERLAAMSDGVFGIAATLLVLEVKVPETDSHAPLREALLNVVPAFLAYGLSFFVIALFWSAYHRILAALHEVDRVLVYSNIVLLFFISLQPFPTALLGRNMGEFIAVALYAAVMALTGIVLLLMWRHALRRPALLRVDPGHQAARALGVRLAVSPAVFVASIPLAWWSTQAAMASWLLMSLYTLASRLRHD